MMDQDLRAAIAIVAVIFTVLIGFGVVAIAN
ncbi:YnhF family membrane protein [Vibrio sp. WXL103]